MVNNGRINNTISFNSEYYECIFTYLYSHSLSSKYILIPIKAQPFPARTTPKMFFKCSLTKGQNISSLSWKSFYSPLEAIAVCLLILICVATWIFSIFKKTMQSFSTLWFLLVESAFTLVVVLYYYFVYRYCNKRFSENIITKIGAINNEGNTEDADQTQNTADGIGVPTDKKD